MFFVTRIVSLILVLLVLASCGNDDANKQPTLLPGYFIDSFVTGLRYETNSVNGSTDADGKFSYVDGENISFYVGNIFIGQAKAGSVMTPLDLVPSAIDETNPQVTNILRFLQTLDSNGDPNDGIVILDAAQNSSFSTTINFAQDVASFESDQELIDYFYSLDQITGNNTTLIPAVTAQNHFYHSVVNIYSKTYAGIFDGDLSGSWMFIANDGVITGTVTQNDIARLVSGQIKIDGSAEVNVFNTSMVFSVSFTKFGLASGNWNDIPNNTSGSFTNYEPHGEITLVYGPTLPYGKLTLNGKDTASLEINAFSPPHLDYTNPDEPYWHWQIGNTLYQMIVIVNSDGTVRESHFYSVNTDTNISYSYSLLCTPGTTSPYCTELANNITVDLDSHIVTFNNLALIPDFFSSATDTLTLTGSLTYLDALVFN